jgi:hypothetical protein
MRFMHARFGARTRAETETENFTWTEDLHARLNRKQAAVDGTHTTHTRSVVWQKHSVSYNAAAERHALVAEWRASHVNTRHSMMMMYVSNLHACTSIHRYQRGTQRRSCCPTVRDMTDRCGHQCCSRATEAMTLCTGGNNCALLTCTIGALQHACVHHTVGPSSTVSDSVCVTDGFFPPPLPITGSGGQEHTDPRSTAYSIRSTCKGRRRGVGTYMCTCWGGT